MPYSSQCILQAKRTSVNSADLRPASTNFKEVHQSPTSIEMQYEQGQTWPPQDLANALFCSSSQVNRKQELCFEDLSHVRGSLNSSTMPFIQGPMAGRSVGNFAHVTPDRSAGLYKGGRWFPRICRASRPHCSTTSLEALLRKELHSTNSIESRSSTKNQCSIAE